MSAITEIVNATPEDAERLAHEKLTDAAYRKRKAQLAADKRVRAEEHPPKPIPKPRTLAERLAHKTQPLPYRVADLMVYGQRVLLVAQYKAGKTTLVLNLVRALVDNRPFLNKYRVAPVVD
ncbi:MAG TPA: AAA family ATPase, partial [Vicinamibacterales bacterium]